MMTEICGKSIRQSEIRQPPAPEVTRARKEGTMNKQRRKAIDTVYAKLEELRDDLEAIRDEEEEARDNLPESLQDGEKGEAMSEAIDNLESAIDGIEEVIEYLEGAMA